MFNMGYVKLHRSLIESDVFAHQMALKIWVYFLLKANFKEKTVPLKVGRGETIVKVPRGSFIFGRFSAENELCINGSTIYKWMQKFKDMDMITIKSNNHYSLVSICNWGEYQVKEDEEKQQSNSKVATKEPQKDTTKKVKKVKNVIRDKNKNQISKDQLEKIFERLEKYPRIAKMESPLTGQQYYNAVKEYGLELVIKKLDSMENKKTLLKDYVSANKTLLNWCKE